MLIPSNLTSCFTFRLNDETSSSLNSFYIQYIYPSYERLMYSMDLYGSSTQNNPLFSPSHPFYIHFCFASLRREQHPKKTPLIVMSISYKLQQVEILNHTVLCYTSQCGVIYPHSYKCDGLTNRVEYKWEQI